MDRLYRSLDDRVIAGVAGGMAEMWDLDPSLVRLGWVVLTPLTAGFTILLYVVLALVVPEEPAPGVELTGTPGVPTPPPGPGVEPRPAPGGEPASAGAPTGQPPYFRYSPGSDSLRDQRRGEKVQRRHALAEWWFAVLHCAGGSLDPLPLLGGTTL